MTLCNIRRSLWLNWELSSSSRVVFAPAFDYNGRAWSMQEPMSLEEDCDHGRCADVA